MTATDHNVKHVLNGLGPVPGCAPCAQRLKTSTPGPDAGREPPWFWSGDDDGNDLDV